MRRTTCIIHLLAAAFCVTATAPLAAAQIDSRLSGYQPTNERLNGTIVSVGSDTLAYVMSFWLVEFKRLYPGVKANMEVEGSATAPPALTEGRAKIGPMSRPMNEKEIESFTRKYGYRPTEIVIARDALAVYVHKQNPLSHLTLPQVDAIFSSARKCGYPGAMTTWNQLSLSGDWSGRAIELFGRDALSGTHAFFRQKALCKGEYRSGIKTRRNTVDVLRGVQTAKGGIGYSGFGHQQAGVKAVPLGYVDGGPYIEPNAANIISGAYPLTRYLYLYVDKHPQKPLDPLTHEFLRFVLSREGQLHVLNDGFVPLDETAAAMERAKF
jgi:phosphate transport system substrate-binding protein